MTHTAIDVAVALQGTVTALRTLLRSKSDPRCGTLLLSAWQNATIGKVLVRGRALGAQDAEIGSPTFTHSDRHPVRNKSLCRALLRLTVRNGSFNQGVYRSTYHVRGLRPAVHLHCRRAGVLRTKRLPKQAEPMPGLPS